MAIGRITGSVLKSNLTRNGVDLAFETNLLYLDVTNSRVGIGTSTPATTLHVVGNSTITGALTAGSFSTDTISVNNLYSTDSTAIQVNDGLNVAGTLNADTITTNTISSGDSSAVSFGSSVSVTGDVTTSGFYYGDGRYLTGLAPTLQNYQFAATASDISTYYVAKNLANYTAGALTSATVSVSTTPTLLASFATEIGFPNITVIPSGKIQVLFETQKALGPNGYYTYAEIYTRTAGGTETLRATTDQSSVLVANTLVQQDVSYFVGTPINSFGLTDRIVIKIYAVMTAGTANITLRWDDNTASSFLLPTLPASATNFVPYINATADVNLGSYGLKASSVTTNSIASDDSSAVQINDSVNVGGTVTAAGLVANGITYPTTDGTANQVLTTNGSGQLSFTSLSAFTGITFVGDDSTGSTINTAETFKIVGGSNITTSVSGDTLTINGSNPAQGITVAGDDSTGTRISDGETIKVVGSSNITTAMSGDTLTITGPDLSSYLTSVPKTIDVNEISSSDSSAIQINDSVNVSGTLNAKTIVTTNISSEDSTAVSINDGLNVSGTAKLSGLIYPTADGTDGQFLKTDGAGNLSFATVSGGGGGGGDSTAADTITYTGFGSNNVAIDTEITVGSVDSSNSIASSAKVFDSFATTDYDSAFYFAVTSNDASSEIGVRSVSIMHNGTNAYNSPGVGVNNGSGDHLLFSSGLSGSTVALYAIGNSSANTATFYRIGLGDSTVSRSSTYISTVINTDVDTATETLDSWSISLYRGAKYYISCTADNGQVSNIEALVVHDGSNAYISTFNEIYSGSGSIITLTAAVNGSNVEVSASASANTSVICYRVILGDSEYTSGGTYSKIVGATTVSSSATVLDTFDTASYVGANYIVVSYNSTESAASVSEVFVASDGLTASVASIFVSSKNSAQLSFTADCSAGIVTLSAASTSGSNTTVNAYRVHLGRPPVASAFKVIDSWSKTSYRGAKYFIAIKGTDINEYNSVEATIVHDGSDAYISTYNLVMTGSTYAAPGMITLSADVSGSLVRLKGVSTGEQNMRVTAVRHRIPI